MTTAVFCVFVAIVILCAIGAVGTNPLASIRTFAICASLSLFGSIAVVGTFTVTHGAPYITRTQ